MEATEARARIPADKATSSFPFRSSPSVVCGVKMLWSGANSKSTILNWGLLAYSKSCALCHPLRCGSPPQTKGEAHLPLTKLLTPQPCTDTSTAAIPSLQTETCACFAAAELLGSNSWHTEPDKAQLPSSSWNRLRHNLHQFHPWLYGGWCGSTPCVQPEVSLGSSASTLRRNRWDRSRTAPRPQQDRGAQNPHSPSRPTPPGKPTLLTWFFLQGTDRLQEKTISQPLPNPTDLVISRQLGAITSASCYTPLCSQHTRGWGRRAASHPTTGPTKPNGKNPEIKREGGGTTTHKQEHTKEKQLCSCF